MNKYNKGFSLIEVLVASLILFLVVVSMMSVYRGALLSSTKATESLELVSLVPHVRTSITEIIRESAFQTQLEGELFYKDTQFFWEANIMANGRAFDLENINFGNSVIMPDTGQGATPMYLWKVTLEVKVGNKLREFEFWEVSW